MPEYTDPERARIIRDIARWKVELVEVGGGGHFSYEKLQQFVDSLRDQNDADLVEFWRGTVGEWVCSRHDVDFGDDPEEFLNDQLDKVAAGEELAYGYVVDVELPEPVGPAQ